jgi:hypothetical protein
MARRGPIAPPVKLAFFVEGDSDKDFIESLAPRILGPSVRTHVVRVGGKAAFASTFAEVAQFLEAGYAAVFVVVDADTVIADDVSLQKQRLADVYRRYGLEGRVQIVMAVPMLETWLLAAYVEHPERSLHPKQDLAKHVGPLNGDTIRSLAAKLPIEVVRRRAKSFDELATGLEAFAPTKARRAS